MSNDHLGTPQKLSNASGAVVWSAIYDPFGNANVNEDVDNDSNNIVFNLRFPGQYYDVETGLHYNGFRTYDPSTGRYITSDPIGLQGGLNTYGYVGGNPLKFTDPLGLNPWDGQQQHNPIPGTYNPTTGQFESVLYRITGADGCVWAQSTNGGWVRESCPTPPQMSPAEREKLRCQKRDDCISKCVRNVLLGEAATQLAEKGGTYTAKKGGSKVLQKFIPIAGQISTANSASGLLKCYIIKCK